MIKAVTKTNKNEAKKQRDGFFSMLLGALSAILLQNMLIGTNLLELVNIFDATKSFWNSKIWPKWTSISRSLFNKWFTERDKRRSAYNELEWYWNSSGCYLW